MAQRYEWGSCPTCDAEIDQLCTSTRRETWGMPTTRPHAERERRPIDKPETDLDALMILRRTERFSPPCPPECGLYAAIVCERGHCAAHCVSANA